MHRITGNVETVNDSFPHLEIAITALKASRDAIRDNRTFEPADLSSLVATVRETAWNLEAVVTHWPQRMAAKPMWAMTTATTRKQPST